MGLTDGSFLVVLCAVALLVAAGGALAMPRVRGGRAAAGCQRVGIVVLCQLAALTVAGAAVNDYGFFYTTWGDLGSAVSQSFGAGHPGHHGGRRDPGHQPVDHRALSDDDDPVSAGAVHVHRSGPSDVARWARTGRLESVSVLGAFTGLRAHAFVYLPPEYFQARYATTRFPGVEVLTGYPGDDRNLVRRVGYPQALAQLERHKRARPMVLVMMRPAVTYPRDTECTDVPSGPQVLTYLATDVTTQIARAFRVESTRWGVIGDSTGGYCAAKIAMTHPLIFSAAASLSGYYFALHDSTTGDLWGGSPLVRDVNDLKWRMTHLPPPPVSLLLVTSRTETGPDGYHEAVSFDRIIRDPTIASLLVERSGGHNFHTWARELPTALVWLSARIGTR